MLEDYLDTRSDDARAEGDVVRPIVASPTCERLCRLERWEDARPDYVDENSYPRSTVCRVT